MDDARRAADELIAAGAGRVLLFGSLARGEQRGASDIDLVAVYDDLDYAEGLDFWKLPPRIGKYVETWNAILAAE